MFVGLQRKSERYYENQNELLKIMAMNILRSIAKNLQETEYITVMID